MQLTTGDIIIILLYISFVLFAGIVFKSNPKNKISYLLGNRKLPWPLIGLSNATSMFDISGTMWLVTMAFVYGMKSLWLPWLWPVFNQIFLMVYLSAWIRRSGVTTGAEWLKTRFGYDRGARLSHTIIVIFSIILSLSLLAYGFVGVGKFVQIILPWQQVQHFLHININIAPQHYYKIYGVIFTLLASIYAIVGGMRSIILTDIIQYSVLTLASLVIAFSAMKTLLVHKLIVPDGWFSPWFGFKLNLDWSNIIPQANEKIAQDGLSLFSVFFMIMLIKGILASMAGPAPSYDMQKILSAPTPADAAKMSASVNVFLNPGRYLMVAGLTALALVHFKDLNLGSSQIDFENLMPAVIQQYIPVGFAGIIIAAMIAAFMSTFASTLNAAQAYLINDIILENKSLNSSRKLVFIEYTTGVLVVVVTIIFGWFISSINAILMWIVSALWGSYILSNMLKWYWWRFNGYGYFWGIFWGLVAAVVLPLLFPSVNSLYLFPFIFLISLIAALIATYLNRPTDINTLKQFYYNVRPWGWWKPIFEKLKRKYPDIKPNQNLKKDLLVIFIGIIWQTSIVAAAMYFVFMRKIQFFIALTLIILTSFLLKKLWWNKLSET